MPVKLVATDLDGTLLRTDGSISPRTSDAIERVQQAGITVVLVTARNWRSVGAIAGAAGVSGLGICSNGAVVYDFERQQVHRAEVSDVAAIRSFVEVVRASTGGCFAWETAFGAYRSPEYHALAQRDVSFARVYLDAIEVLAHPEDEHEVTKLLIRHPTLGPDELLDLLLPHAGELTLTVSGGPFVEATRAGVTKAFALEQLCSERGIERSDVVAVGDQPNDLPMLSWAGRGVAMGNSHPAVLATTEERTATNDEDGLALVLESLVN